PRPPPRLSRGKAGARDRRRTTWTDDGTALPSGGAGKAGLVMDRLKDTTQPHRAIDARGSWPVPARCTVAPSTQPATPDATRPTAATGGPGPGAICAQEAGLRLEDQLDPKRMMPGAGLVGQGRPGWWVR